MEFHYRAQISIAIEIVDEDFDFLMKVCERHYDSAVGALAQPGSPLWGSKNRRTWHKEDPAKFTQDLTVELTIRRLDRLIKSLEMERTAQTGRLYIQLLNIYRQLGEESNRVDEIYTVKTQYG